MQIKKVMNLIEGKNENNIPLGIQVIVAGILLALFQIRFGLNYDETLSLLASNTKKDILKYIKMECKINTMEAKKCN